MLCAVDVGSNTLRLLLGQIRDGQVLPERYVHRTTRLAGGIDRHGRLTPESMDRTLSGLAEFAAMIDAAAPENQRIVGTEALRRACNGDHFVDAVKNRTGLDLEILDGAEEARLSSNGMRAALQPSPADCLMFDIGGASTEFILVLDQRVRYRRSLPLGVVRLCENHSSEIAQRKHIDEMVEQVVEDMQRLHLLDAVLAPQVLLAGTAGTVTTLAAMKLRMHTYDGLRINNQYLSPQDLFALHKLMAPLSPGEREQLPGLEPQRGDLIMPGLLIVSAIFETFAKSLMKVSDFGLLEGVLLDMGHEGCARRGATAHPALPQPY